MYACASGEMGEGAMGEEAGAGIFGLRPWASARGGHYPANVRAWRIVTSAKLQTNFEICK